MRMHNPPHPGLVLREYLGNLSVSTAAAHLRVTRVTLSRVLNGKSGISAAMAIRLAAALGTSPELWINMQSQYDLWRAPQTPPPPKPKVAPVAHLEAAPPCLPPRVVVEFFGSKGPRSTICAHP